MKKEQENRKKDLEAGELKALSNDQLRSIKGGDDDAAAVVIDNGSGMVKGG